MIAGRMEIDKFVVNVTYASLMKTLICKQNKIKIYTKIYEISAQCRKSLFE